MTLVELFEKSVIDNLCSSMIIIPDRIVFVGTSKKEMQRVFDEKYIRFFGLRRATVETVYVSLDPLDPKSAVDTFDELTRKYDDCVFDLTGGNESFIVAAARISERYPERGIQLHKFNVKNGTIIDLDLDGKTILDGERTPEISVREIIALNGGRVIFDDERVGGTHVFDDSILDDPLVDKLWTICKDSDNNWNEAIHYVLDCISKLPNKNMIFNGGEEYNKVPFSMKEASENIRKVLNAIRNEKLITIANENGVEMLTFASETVKRCMSKEGILLEIQLYRLAKKAKMPQKKNDTSPPEKVFTDAMTGVLIDIDGHEESELTNEIDVILQRGLQSVFISCKNGDLKTEEIFKLKTVADRFGGKYAKPVLALGTKLDDVKLETIKKIAKDYNITVLETYQYSTDTQLQNRLRTFVLPK